MKTLSKWLLATSFSIISFLVAAMLYAQVKDDQLQPYPTYCWEVSCF